MPNPLTILPPVQDRGAAYAGVLSQILGVHEQNRQAEKAKRQAAEDQRTNAVKAALTPYAGQPQLLTRALALLAPDDRQRAQKAGFGIVAPMESPEQTLDRTRATAQTNDITGQQPTPTPPVPAPTTPQAATPSQIPDMPPVGAGAGIGVPPPAAAGPTPNEIVDQKVRQFEAIYKHAPAKEQVDQWFQAALLGPQGQVTAAQMASKIVPTAQEGIKNAADAQTFSQVTLPKSQADVANVKSETAFRQGPQTAETVAKTTEARANTGKIGAETVKTGEEIKALRQSNDPVVKSILARSLAEGVIADPQSFHGMPMADKTLVVNFLHRAPVKLSASEIDQINTSENGLNLLRDTRAIVDKWAKRGVNITGPVLGRYEEAANKFGDGIMPPQLTPEQKTEFAQDISKMHEWLTVLPILETKALVGSRPAKEIIARVAGVTPSLSKATDFFDGAMAGTEQRLQERAKTLSAKPWNGRPPVLDGASAGKSLDEATARQFLQRAGGDKAKARELAKAAGYTF